jgi:hypothetical protein
MQEKLTSFDVIALNTSKAWGFNDYMNFHVQEEKEEYIKLKNFIEKYRLHLKVGLSIVGCITAENFRKFRIGEFIFENESGDEVVGLCIELRKAVKKSIGYSGFVDTARFWKACIKICKHPDFNLDKTVCNILFLSDRIYPKAKESEYFNMIRDIHNYRNPVKIEKEYVSE